MPFARNPASRFTPPRGVPPAIRARCGPHDRRFGAECLERPWLAPSIDGGENDVGRFRCAPVRGWPATAAWHPQSSWHSFHRQAAGTVVIAVLIGLPVTLAATWISWTQDRHNERRLQQIQTRQAAAVIDSTVIGIVEFSGGGVTIADDLQSNGDGTVSGHGDARRPEAAVLSLLRNPKAARAATRHLRLQAPAAEHATGRVTGARRAA